MKKLKSIVVLLISISLISFLAFNSILANELSENFMPKRPSLNWHGHHNEYRACVCDEIKVCERCVKIGLLTPLHGSSCLWH